MNNHVKNCKILTSWVSPSLKLSDYIHPVYLRFDCAMSSNITFPNFILDGLHIMSLEDLAIQLQGINSLPIENTEKAHAVLHQKLGITG